MQRFVFALAAVVALSPVPAGAAVLLPPADVATAEALLPAGEPADALAHRVDVAAAQLRALDLGGRRKLPGILAASGAPADRLPEPTTWLMIFFGFFGLAFAVRRRDTGSRTRVRFT